MTPNDDDEATPVEPIIERRKSGQHGLGLSDCPACASDRTAFCDVCLGARKVPLSVATAWLLEQGHALDTPIPDTEPER
jgi:hypothetical protein